MYKGLLLCLNNNVIFSTAWHHRTIRYRLRIQAGSRSPKITIEKCNNWCHDWNTINIMVLGEVQVCVWTENSRRKLRKRKRSNDSMHVWIIAWFKKSKQHRSVNQMEIYLGCHPRKGSSHGHFRCTSHESRGAEITNLKGNLNQHLQLNQLTSHGQQCDLGD